MRGDERTSNQVPRRRRKNGMVDGTSHCSLLMFPSSEGNWNSLRPLRTGTVGGDDETGRIGFNLLEDIKV